MVGNVLQASQMLKLKKLMINLYRFCIFLYIYIYITLATAGIRWFETSERDELFNKIYSNL